jgi:diguanylate cyclase (GGDEF)-like protein
LLWLASWAAPGDATSRGATYTLGALALHVYAAWMIARLAKFNDSAALKALVAIQLLAAGVQAYGLAHAGWGATPGAGLDAWILAGSLGTALAALAMVLVALLLTFERTEVNLRAAQQKLRFLADMDVLTEVPNRRHFHELATRALASSVGSSSTVMMFDIDHFKQVNDLLGHATGDEALRQVAHCIRETLRGQDVAGRMGGDEFAVLLPQTDVDDAMAVAERIASRLEDRQVAPRIARISLSFGVVQMRSNENVVEALRRADHALYEAKRQGRSRAVVAVGAEDHLLFGESRSLGLPGF